MVKITKYTKALLMFIVLAACSDPFSKQIKPDGGNRAIPTNDNAVRFNGDFLEFSSQKAFDETLASLRNQSSDDILAWSKHFGLTSMREIYEKAKAEQALYMDKLAAQYVSYPENDPRKKIKPTLVQQSLATKYAALLNFDESGLITGLKEFHFDAAGVLNKDGIVMINGNIFQYNEANVKVIEGRDRSKIAKLSSIEKTDEKQRIFVTPVTSKFARVSPNGRYEYTSSLSAVYGEVHTYYSIAIHTYYTAILGPKVCDCLPPSTGPNAPRLDPTLNPTPCDDTYCTYPIVGYDARTVYTTQMSEMHNGFAGIWTCFKPSNSYMTGWWGHGTTSTSFEFTVSDVSDWTRTIYDGPGLNIIYGNHTYSWYTNNIATMGWGFGSGPSAWSPIYVNTFND